MLNIQASHPRPTIRRKPGSCTACRKAKVRCEGEPTCKRCEKNKIRCERPFKMNTSSTDSNTAAKKMTDIGQKLASQSLDPGISSPLGSSEKSSRTPCNQGQFDCRTESPTSTKYQRSGSVCISQEAPHRQYTRRKESCLACRGKKRRVSPRHHSYNKILM